ncbi:MAG: (d)CMP kinase [Lachnospiraceae bacterium]|nr:(d)CMP kinase [Lachnospiraceae bacterium]
MSFSIAIDGPAGAGKSTIAKKIAKERNLIYVDTGAMYRAMALYLLRAGIAAQDSAAISEKCKSADITIQYEKGEQLVYLNGENVTPFLRTEEVGKMASASSVNGDVRKKLVQLQQKLAERADVIMDGRDIGTCVLPGADVKIYLTASVEVRARRRYDELTAKGENWDLEEIEREIAQRDHRDMTRDISPLRQAQDAILLDTSHMDIQEVVTAIIKICEEKCGWK